jgi:hypothetical protein
MLIKVLSNCPKLPIDESGADRALEEICDTPREDIVLL